MGVLILQAFWITDSYTERQAHFKEHIYNVLNEVSKDYCKNYLQDSFINMPSKENSVMDSILIAKLNQVQESTSFQFQISDHNEAANLKLITEDYFHFSEELNCEKNYSKTLHLYILNDKFYFLGSILSWVIISSLLIIVSIVALFYNLSFMNR